MSLPVGIQGDDIRTVQFPFASHGYGGIVVLQIPRLDVHPRVMTTGTVDAFPVDAAISIQFNGWCQLIGESLCNLPVGMPIHSLVA